ncbi:MAG: hypothetical protein D6732_15165 [Methanobacteriota archaeon]|nr:MAG: hypothetical protein D6732_15165 [Euryarchaeota archaeon]
MDFLASVKKKKKLSKVVVVGSGAVGKTSFLKVLKSGKLLDELELDFHRTLFMEFEALKIDDNSFLMMDVAGQIDLPIHALKDFERLALGRTDLVIMMFAANSMQSFLDLEVWFSLVNKYFENQREQPPTFIVIQNKLDLERNVTEEMIDSVKLAVPKISRWFDLSLKTGLGLKEIFDYLGSFGGD